MRTYPDTSVIAFEIPNADQINGKLPEFSISVDELEAKLGIDLFPQLPDELEARIESYVAAEEWTISEGGGFNRMGLQCMDFFLHQEH